MNRIDKTFKNLKARRQKAFIAYITAGDPDMRTTEKILLALERSGVDIIELGIPFSDPLADGPVIQAASQRALAKGAKLAKIFALVSRIRTKSDIPIVFMTYYNPVLKYGLDKFFKSCRRSGVDGVIVPDLPAEEAGELVRFAKPAGVATIFLVAPTSDRNRIKKITRLSKGFVYYVSLTGVTGTRTKLPKELLANVRRVKSLTDKPVAVGFGVSDTSQARGIARAADGVIVGSAIVRIIGEKKNAIRRVSEFARKLSKAIHNE